MKVTWAIRILTKGKKMLHDVLRGKATEIKENLLKQRKKKHFQRSRNRRLSKNETNNLEIKDKKE